MAAIDKNGSVCSAAAGFEESDMMKFDGNGEMLKVS